MNTLLFVALQVQQLAQPLRLLPLLLLQPPLLESHLALDLALLGALHGADDR